MATPKLEKLVLPAADGGPLHVDVRTGARPGEARPTVVICHGFKGFKDWGMFPKLAERLAGAGFTAVSFNFSGSGVSDGDTFDELDRWYHQRPSADLRDIDTVVGHAAAAGASWIGLLGHSRGGGLAILHASRDARIKALATWAAVDHFMRWPAEEIRRWRELGEIDVQNQRTGQVLKLGPDALADIDENGDSVLDVMAAAPQVRCPWLIVHGTEDATVPVQVGEILGELSGSRDTESLIVDGANHTFGARHPWAGAGEHTELVFDRTVEFFAKHL